LRSEEDFWIVFRADKTHGVFVWGMWGRLCGRCSQQVCVGSSSPELQGLPGAGLKAAAAVCAWGLCHDDDAGGGGCGGEWCSWSIVVIRPNSFNSFICCFSFFTCIHTSTVDAFQSIAFSLKHVVINFIWLSSGYIITQCCQLFNLIVFPLFSFTVLCL